MKKIETFLPIFTGFYHTYFDMDDQQLESELNELEINYDDADIDYKSWQNDIVKGLCNFVEDNCPLIASVTLQDIVSPKEYNFRNDSANVLIEYDEIEFSKWLLNNIDDLKLYLDEKYTSCSGFISSYSNDVNVWLMETKSFLELDIDGHRLGSLLNFYFEMELDMEEYEIVDSIKENEGIYEGMYIQVKELEK